MLRTTPRKRLDLHLRYLLSRITSHWACCCSAPHRAGLLLYTQSNLREDVEACAFTLLLNRKEPGRSWQEAHVTIKEANDTMKQHLLPAHTFRHRPGFLLPEQSEEGGRSVGSLCQAVQVNSPYRLGLVLEQSSIRELSRTEPPMSEWEDGSLVSLEHGLLSVHQAPFPLKYRLPLALVLSYSLLDFCDESWFSAGWTARYIYFFQQAARLSLRPILVAPGGDRKGASTSTEARLLLHGILLMEIFAQRRISPTTHCTDLAELRNIACQEFNAVSWDTYERYKTCVRECIEGLLSPNIAPDEDLFHHAVLRIIDLVSADHVAAWEGQDPDEVLTNLHLPAVNIAVESPRSIAQGASITVNGHKGTRAFFKSKPAPPPKHGLAIKGPKPPRPTTPKPNVFKVSLHLSFFLDSTDMDFEA